MSLSEIQEQEEKNRLAHEEKMKELQAKQRQLHSSASHGWSSEKYVEHIPSPISHVFMWISRVIT